MGCTLCNCLLLTHALYQVFTKFVCCVTRNTLLIFFALIRLLLQKVMHFQSKWLVLILLFPAVSCFAPFSQFCHHETTNSFIFSLCMASYLASHQIMWHNKISHRHGLKITSFCCFFGFQWDQVRGWYYLHNFKLQI